MNILIFAGTKNGRELVEELLTYGCRIFVSSMSEHGDKLLPEGHNMIKFFGKKSIHEIGEVIVENAINLVIDSTHPYAKEVSMNIKEACETTKTKLIRYERKSSIPEGIGNHFKSMLDVCKYLSVKEGNILFTTGINEVPNIVKSIDVGRIYVRIIPVKSSIDKAISCKLNMNNVIQKNPPFYYDENIRHINENRIKYLVTKDSGAEGNTDAKIEAATATGVEILVIDRPLIKYDHLYYGQDELIKALKL